MDDRIARSLKWGTGIFGFLMLLSAARDLILQWDGWLPLMIFRITVITTLFVTPWLLSRTKYGENRRGDIVVFSLSMMFIAMTIMFIWMTSLPWGSKALISVLFLPVLAATTALTPIGFRGTAVLCLTGTLAFTIAYSQLHSTLIEFGIMVWSVFALAGIMVGASWRLEKQERLNWFTSRELEAAQAASTELLENVFPKPVAQRLLKSNEPIADRHESVVVIFADVVGFTPMAREMSAGQLVEQLDRLFSDFDELVRKQTFTKIKTIGDSYMTVGGLPWEPSDNRVQAGARLGWDLIECAHKEHALNLRVGLHVGPCVAGVIGKERFVYDFWGETVNIASRLESSGHVGRVHISVDVMSALADESCYQIDGERVLKGVGTVTVGSLIQRPG